MIEEWGELKESIEGMMEEVGLTIAKAKQCKIRIEQTVYNDDLTYLRTAEKEIVSIRLDKKKAEVVISLADTYESAMEAKRKGK